MSKHQIKDPRTSPSNDPDGNPLSFHWDFGDGSTGGGETTSHTFASGGTMTVVLTVLDSGGLSATSVIQITVEAPSTPVEEAGEIPRTLALSSNYPNPFRSATTLRFELPVRTDVDLRVVDLLGRTVARLVEGPMEAGVHTVRFEAGSLPSGVYLARLRAGSATQTRKLMLLR